MHWSVKVFCAIVVVAVVCKRQEMVYAEYEQKYLDLQTRIAKTVKNFSEERDKLYETHHELSANLQLCRAFADYQMATGKDVRAIGADILMLAPQQGGPAGVLKDEAKKRIAA